MGNTIEKTRMNDFIALEKIQIEKELKEVRTKLLMAERTLDAQTKELLYYRNRITEIKKTLSKMENLFARLKELRGELDGQ